MGSPTERGGYDADRRGGGGGGEGEGRGEVATFYPLYICVYTIN